MIVLQQQGLVVYFKNKKNVQSQVYFIVFYCYFTFRMEDPSISILPLYHRKISGWTRGGGGSEILKENGFVHGDITLDLAVEQSVLHWFLIVVGMMQLLEIVKVQKTIG